MPLPKRPRGEPSRPSPAPRITDDEQLVLHVIKAKEDMGISRAELKAVTKIVPNRVDKSIKSLLSKNKIKEVRSVRKAGARMLMAAEFEPSKEVSGGSWYTDGVLNTDLVTALRMCCRICIEGKGAATEGTVRRFIQKTGVLVDMEITTQQTLEILQLMVLDREIEQCTSTGTEEFGSVEAGTSCYRLSKWRAGGQARGRGSAMASIPCGVCPRLRDCTPDGIISPKTCVYYDRWLDAVDF